MAVLICLLVATALQRPDLVPPHDPQQRVALSIFQERPHARDVAFIGNTIIIADAESTAHVSRDGGVTWKASRMLAPVHALAVDELQGLWGLHRWHGIDGPSVSALVHSRDEGATWSRIEFDGALFLPEAFVGDGRELVVLSADGQLWRHVAGETETPANWQRLGRPNPDRRGVCGKRAGLDTFLVSSRDAVYFSTDQGETWQHLHSAGVLAFLPMLRFFTCGTGPQEEYALTGSGQLLEFTSELAGEGTRCAWTYRNPRVARQLAGMSTVYQACDAWPQAAASGVDAEGKPIVLYIEQERDLRLPAIDFGPSVRIRSGGSDLWLLGDGAYKLSPERDRWMRVWPKP